MLFSQGSRETPRFSIQWYSWTAPPSWPRGADRMPTGKREKSSRKSSSPDGEAGVAPIPSSSRSPNVLIAIPPSASDFQGQPIPALRDLHPRRRHEPPLVRPDLSRLELRAV